jgi:hypothetical protein
VTLVAKMYKTNVYIPKRIKAIVEMDNPNVSVAKMNKSREKNKGLPL